MPARSRAQQRFFGMCAHADHPPASCPRGMTRAQMREFARTPHRGLPEHVEGRRARDRGGRRGRD